MIIDGHDVRMPEWRKSGKECPVCLSNKTVLGRFWGKEFQLKCEVCRFQWWEGEGE